MINFTTIKKLKKLNYKIKIEENKIDISKLDHWTVIHILKDGVKIIYSWKMNGEFAHNTETALQYVLFNFENELKLKHNFFKKFKKTGHDCSNIIDFNEIEELEKLKYISKKLLDIS